MGGARMPVHPICRYLAGLLGRGGGRDEVCRAAANLQGHCRCGTLGGLICCRHVRACVYVWMGGMRGLCAPHRASGLGWGRGS